MDKTSLVLGLPIETEIGTLYPTKVKDYPKFLQYQTLLLKQDFEFKEEISQGLTEDISYMIKNSEHIFELMRHIRASFPVEENYFSFLYEEYRKMFEFHFKEDVVDKIKTGEDFEYYRDLIMEVNAVSYEKPNPNPEIQGAIDLHNELQKNKGNATSFESVVTSVALFFSVDINELTIYQLYAYFERAIKYTSFETTRLFRMFSDEVKIEDWYTDIKKKKKEEMTISEDEIDNVNIGELTPLILKPKETMKEW